MIAIRASLGSEAPAGILGTTLFATACSTTAAIAACLLFQRFSPLPPPDRELPEAAVEAVEDHGAYPLWVSLTALGCAAGAIPILLVYGDVLAPWIVPLLIVGIAVYGWLSGVAVYEAFVEGAKEGFEVAVRIIPYLVAILSAVGMLRGSGALGAFVDLLQPVTESIGLPAEALPMALLLPLSGSGSLGVMMDTMNTHGADSFVGYLVSTMQGSTETTFYVIAVYFGAVQVQRIRHTMAAALTADLTGDPRRDGGGVDVLVLRRTGVGCRPRRLH